MKNLDRVLVYPGDDLWSRLVFVEHAQKLQKIYTQIGQPSVYEKMTVEKYTGEKVLVKDVLNMIEKEAIQYETASGGLMYSKNCDYDCTSFSASGKYIILGLEYPGIDRKNVYAFYQDILEERKDRGRGISLSDLRAVASMKDVETFDTYFTASMIGTNEDKIQYIELYHLLGVKGKNTDEYVKDLKNSILIEGRGVFLGGTNTTRATARFVPILTKYDEENTFLIENALRYILSHRSEEGVYYSSDFGSVMDAVSAYFDIYDPKATDFTAEAFLNGKAVQDYTFNQKNLFETITTQLEWTDDLPKSLGFEKKGTGKLFYDIGVKYFLPASDLEAREEGMTIHRAYYDYGAYQEAYERNCFIPRYFYEYGNWRPLCTQKKLKNIDAITSTKLGNTIVAEIELVLDRPRSNIAIRDFIPAGMEIVNAQFETTSQQDTEFLSDRMFDIEEARSDHMYLFSEYLSAGRYTYRFLLKANYAGEYQSKPVHAELPQTQEIWGRGKGGIFTITK